LLASVLVAQGALAEAEVTLAWVLDPATGMQTQGERQLWCARAELALARDDPAGALAILDRLYATAANLRDEGDIPRLVRLKAAALVALGEPDLAGHLLRAGLRTAEAQGLATLRWQLRAALGDLHRRQGRPDDAAREHAAARRLIDELAAAVPEGDLREGFTRGALALLTPLSARRAAKELYGGLTAREREVAALIAQGHANRAIADTLSVGERTVETHVSNILLKLGFTTRTQIATWATVRDLPART
jgi:DNA-binding CsgD family transcriptional regulator